jgi:hypothetical protein
MLRAVLTIDHTKYTEDHYDMPITVESAGWPAINDFLAYDWEKLQVTDESDTQCWIEKTEWDAVNNRVEITFKSTEISYVTDKPYYFTIGEDVNPYIGATGSVAAQRVWANDDSTIANDTGTANDLPMTVLGAQVKTITVTSAGTFTVTLPTITNGGTVKSGTATITGSPVTLVAGVNTITAEGTGTFTVTINGYVYASHMNDLTTSSIADSTSNNITSTKKGANEPVEVDGLVGKAQSFDGVDDLIDCGNGAVLNSISELSIQALVTIISGNGWVIGRGDWFQNYCLQVEPAGKIYFRYRQSDDSTDVRASTTNVTASTPHSVVVTYDDSTKEINFYLDGAADGTATPTLNLKTTGWQNLWLGRTAGAYGDITIDEVRISNVTRTADDAKIFNSNLKDKDLFTLEILPEIPQPAQKYVIEIHDTDGNLISILENAYNRVYTQRVNEPQSLNFSIPADDDKVSGLVKPNQIWLRDYSTGTLIRKFVITRLVKKDSGNCTYQVECKGYLSKLLKAVVQSYSPSGKTPTEILTALLAYQTLDTITLGTVDITGTYSFSWSNTTVLACLNDCLNAWGGYFDVDNDNELTWLDDIGSDVGQQIRYKKNLVTVEVETDYEGQNSRIYATGNSLDLMDFEPSFDPVTQSSDASYGYLTLQDYKCYTGWTGDGDALPYGVGYDITVYRVSSEFSISFFSCSGAGWTNPNNAIDGSTATNTYYQTSTWTGYLSASVDVTPELCTGLRWYIGADNSTFLDDIEVQYTSNGTDWTTVVSAWNPAWFNNWGQYDFASLTLVKGMRIRVHSDSYSQYIYIYEMEMRSTYADDTADFVQGANEQIVKCAIGDYHSGDTYYLGYTHALYIKDFTAAAAYGDEAINATFNYAGDAETLLKYAQAQMALVKNPPKYYQSGIIFLNEVDTNFSEEELDLGNIVKIIHKPLSVDNSVRIVAMTQDLDNPMNGSIEIQTKIRSLTDAFRSLWNK